MSLYENINRRRRAGISRPKSKSKLSSKAYADMKKGFPNSKKNKARERDVQRKPRLKNLVRQKHPQKAPKNNYFSNLMKTEEGRQLRKQWSNKPRKMQVDQKVFQMDTHRNN